jgi:transposase
MDTQTLPGMDVETVPCNIAVGDRGGHDGALRLRRPDRAQMLLRPQCLEELVTADHRVRTVWAVVERLELGGFYAAIRARGEDPGRSATDPKLLVALWLYAHVDGVGSARELERRCGEHTAYQWLCGGVNLNHHTLSDFRTGHEKALDALFTDLLAMMQHKGLVRIERISQDGMRVRASAGASSFRRRETLQRLVREAGERVETLKRQLDGPAAAECSARKRAAEERAAQERVERIERALAILPKLEEAKEKLGRKPVLSLEGIAAAKTKEVRASTTDAEARVMKMPDGGFRPGYNVQLAADTESRAVVGVEVTNSGVDSGQAEPMRRQVEERGGGAVKEHLYDGGYLRLEDIDAAQEGGVKVYAPPKPPRNKEQRASAYEPRRDDSPAVAEWRRRMGSPGAQAVYKLRAATSETVNAELRAYRSLDRMLVRGMAKVRCVALWAALAYNVVHFGRMLMS